MSVTCVSTRRSRRRRAGRRGLRSPAQREANRRKADQLGATGRRGVRGRGEPAKPSDRPELMPDDPVRDRASGRVLHRPQGRPCQEPRRRRMASHRTPTPGHACPPGENIDETLRDAAKRHHVHHRRVSTPATSPPRSSRVCRQKAAQGGTVTKAPIGYRNVGVRDEFGREVRTVEIDEERARLVRWAFQVLHPVTGRRASSTRNSWRGAHD